MISCQGLEIGLCVLLSLSLLELECLCRMLLVPHIGSPVRCSDAEPRLLWCSVHSLLYFSLYISLSFFKKYLFPFRTLPALSRPWFEHSTLPLWNVPPFVRQLLPNSERKSHRVCLTISLPGTCTPLLKMILTAVRSVLCSGNLSNRLLDGVAGPVGKCTRHCLWPLVCSSSSLWASRVIALWKGRTTGSPCLTVSLAWTEDGELGSHAWLYSIQGPYEMFSNTADFTLLSSLFFICDSTLFIEFILLAV